MRRWGHSGGTTGYTPNPPDDPDPITVTSFWVGDVADDGAQVRIRSTDAASAVLRYSVVSDMSGYDTVAGSEGTDDVWTFEIPDLAPSTRYYYTVEGDTADQLGTFVTFPTAGAYSFGVAAASCAGHSGGEYESGDVSNPPTFDKIRERMESGDIIGFLHLGDRHYRDINSDNDALFQDAYHDVMAQDKQLAMHLAGWVDYVWDDHDFGPNDSHAGSASKPAAQTVYRQHVPWTLADDEGIYHTYVIGRVRFIMLDVRSFRSTNGSTDNSSKTMLGADQKAWLLDVLDNATEPCIVIDSGSPWNGDDSITWGVFSTERDELIAEFSSLGVTDRLLIIHGDNHFLAGDDGTNAPGGIPTFNLAGLDAGFTTNDGTWSTGIFKSEQQQYGTLHFDDDGSDITVTVKGWSVNSSGVETERFSVDLTY